MTLATDIQLLNPTFFIILHALNLNWPSKKISPQPPAESMMAQKPQMAPMFPPPPANIFPPPPSNAIPAPPVRSLFLCVDYYFIYL